VVLSRLRRLTLDWFSAEYILPAIAVGVEPLFFRLGTRNSSLLSAAMRDFLRKSNVESLHLTTNGDRQWIPWFR
jgi:hypothetical protein